MKRVLPEFNADWNIKKRPSLETKYYVTWSDPDEDGGRNKLTKEMRKMGSVFEVDGRPDDYSDTLSNIPAGTSADRRIGEKVSWVDIHIRGNITWPFIQNTAEGTEELNPNMIESPYSGNARIMLVHDKQYCYNGNETVIPEGSELWINGTQASDIIAFLNPAWRTRFTILEDWILPMGPVNTSISSFVEFGDEFPIINLYTAGNSNIRYFEIRHTFEKPIQAEFETKTFDYPDDQPIDICAGDALWLYACIDLHREISAEDETEKPMLRYNSVLSFLG